MMGAISDDEATATTQQVRDEEFAEVKEVIHVDEETGEVLNEGDLQKIAAHEVPDGSEDDENKNPFES